MVDLGHEFEVVRTECTRCPEFRICPMAPRPPLGVNRNPVGMIVVHILMRSMRVRPRNDDHAQLAASCKQITEWVRFIHPGTAIVKWHLGGIIGNTSASAQARRVGMHTPEILEPELQVVLSWIVFNQRKLRPSHRPIKPSRTTWSGRS